MSVLYQNPTLGGRIKAALSPGGIMSPAAGGSTSAEEMDSNVGVRAATCARLGLPADASDEQVLASVDAAIATCNAREAARASADPQFSIDDLVYAKAFGGDAAAIETFDAMTKAQPRALTDDELYRQAFGES